MRLPDDIQDANVLVFSLLALGTTLSGRSLLALAAPNYISRHLESWLLCSVVGTAFWILLAGALTHLGLSMAAARIPMLSILLLTVLAALLRNPKAFLPSRLSMTGAFVFGSVLYVVSLGLVEMLDEGRMYPIFNDAFLYASQSNYMQSACYAEPVDPSLSNSPLCEIPYQSQQHYYRMGVNYLQAFIHSWAPRHDCFEVFLPLSVWGFALNLFAVFLLVRWGFRLPRWAGVMAVLFAAIGPNPIYTTFERSFQHQLFGTAFLCTGLAVLEYVRIPGRWNFQSAFTLGMIVAGLISGYPELAPFLATAAVFYLPGRIYRALQRGQGGTYACFAAWTIFLMLLFGNLEWLRGYRGIFEIMALSGKKMGYPIDWTTEQWCRSITGVDWNVGKPREGVDFATRELLIMLVLGLVPAVRRTATTVLPVFLMFAGMGAYFALAVKDPFTGNVGHTFNCFKTVNWSYPLLCTLMAAGFSVVLRPLRPGPRSLWIWAVPALVFLLGGWTAYPVIVEDFAKEGAEMKVHLGTEHPMKFFSEIRTKIDSVHPNGVYFIRNTDRLWPERLGPYLVWPRPMWNAWDWGFSASPGEYKRTEEPQYKEPGVLFFSSPQPNFTNDYEKLVGNYYRLTKTQPYFYATDGVPESPAVYVSHLFVFESGEHTCEIVRGLSPESTVSKGKMRFTIEGIPEPIDVEFEGAVGHAKMNLKHGHWRVRIENMDRTKDGQPIPIGIASIVWGQVKPIDP